MLWIVMNWRGLLIMLMKLLWLVLMVMMIVRGLDGDLHCHGLFVEDWQWDVLLVNDWSVDWNVHWVRHWLLDDVWDLSDDLDWSRDWDFDGNVDLLDHLNRVWSINFHVNWIFHVFDDLNWIRFLDFDWIRSVNMAVGGINHRNVSVINNPQMIVVDETE